MTSHSVFEALSLLCILGFSVPSLDAGAPIYPPDQPRYEHSESAWEGSDLPPAGVILPDRDFETSIRRITDPQPGEWVPHHDYAKTQAFNADGTLYRFSSVAVYDARSLERIIDLPNLYRALWSNTDPDVLFGFKQNERQVWRYRLSTGVTEVVIDLSEDPECEYMDLGPGEGNIDAADRYAALVCRSGADLLVLSFDLQTGNELTRRRFPGTWAGGGDMIDLVDWVSVSQDGLSTLVMWDHNRTSPENPYVVDGEDHYGIEVFDTATLSFQRRLWYYGNHGDCCVDTEGNPVFVQFAGPAGSYVNMFRIADGLHTSIINDDQNPDGDILADFYNHGGHISCRNLKRPGWAYLSIDHNNDLPDDFINGGEIMAVKLDGSGVVEHFVHHRSSAEGYRTTPMPAPSPDGSIVVYTTDWEGSADEVPWWEFFVGMELGNLFEDGFEDASTGRWDSVSSGNSP